MTEHPFSPTLKPMEARTRTTFPGDGWAYEPKWDGFRCLAWSAPVLRLDSRNERPLLRYFPELLPALEALPAGTLVDGEVVVVHDDVLDFDLLQNRLHPAASRVERLSREIPSQLVAFDLLALDGEDLTRRPFAQRRVALERLAAGLPAPWNLTPSTTDLATAERWFDAYEAAGCDGIVAKRLDGTYAFAERAMAKIKHRRSVDTVVVGFREHTDTKGVAGEGKVGSLLLALYDEVTGELHHVGHCAGLKDAQREELYALLLRYARDDHGLSDEPSEPSRWSGDKDMTWVPVEPALVLQVSHDQMLHGRFRHAARFERWRPDKDPADCTTAQLAPPEGPGFSEVVASGGGAA